MIQPWSDPIQKNPATPASQTRALIFWAWRGMATSRIASRITKEAELRRQVGTTRRLAHIVMMAQLVLGVGSSFAKAQSQPPRQPAIYSRTNHRHKVARQEGRQITVHEATPSWLTLGTDASSGHRGNYATSTFDAPSPVEGTFSGYRGRERVIDQYGVPGVPLFRF
jgi:hypothetical protein